MGNVDAGKTTDTDGNDILELAQQSLVEFDAYKPWPEAMIKLQARLIPQIDHDDINSFAPALQWAWKTVAPWPSCENHRNGERGDHLLRALESLTNRALPDHFSGNHLDVYGTNQGPLLPNRAKRPDTPHATLSAESYAIMTFGPARPTKENGDKG